MVIGTTTDSHEWAGPGGPTCDHFSFSAIVHGRSMVMNCGQLGNAKGQRFLYLL
jgi:hypothetical protein